MRRTAYLRALEEASLAPRQIDSLYVRFGKYVSPRDLAIHAIKELARADNKLFHSELVEILTWKATDAKGNDHNTSAEQATSQEDRVNT